MCAHVHGLHIYVACVHACACRWGSCPPSQLPAETNQAESFQAAGLDGIDSLAELLTLTICSFKVSLTSHKPHCFPETYYIVCCSSWQKLQRSFPPWNLLLAVTLCKLRGGIQKQVQFIQKPWLLYGAKRHFPGSWTQALTVHLHIMEIWFNLLEHSGLIAIDSDASKPVVPVVSPLSSRRLTGSIFIPENSPLVCCTFTLPSSVFLPLSRGLRAACVSCKQVPAPHPHRLAHAHTYTRAHT